MKHFSTYLLIGILFMAACQGKKDKQGSGDSGGDTPETDTTQQISLEEVWSTDTVFKTPESVLYDKGDDILYVSNIQGGSNAQDGKGFISKVSKDGEVKTMKFAKNLDAPKGMGLHDGKLYVTDVNKIREIDAKSGKVLNSYPVKGSVFMNDLAVGNDGTVYASDTETGSIHTLKDGKVSTLIQDTVGLKRINGLYAEDGMLATVSAKGLKMLDLADTSLTSFATGMKPGDGIEADGEGNYVVTSWSGHVYFVSKKGEVTELQNVEGERNTADIGYDKEKDIVYIPTFSDDRVFAYKVKK